MKMPFPPPADHPPRDLAAAGTMALCIFAILCFQPALFNDGDTGWHLATGRLIAATGRIPITDPFSFTRPGAPWVTHEWLAELAMALAWRGGGWAGLAMLASAAAAGLALLLGGAFSRWLPPVRTLIALLLVAIMLVPFTLARPHLLAWPLLAGWTLLLMRAADAGRAPPLAAAALMLLWANLHGSFLFGLALLGPFGLESVLAARDRRRAMAGWVLFAVTAVLAAVATPSGINGLIYPLQVSGMTTLGLIAEWRPTVLTRDWTFTAPLVVVAAMLAWLRPQVGLLRLLVLLALVWLAFAHVRHQALLAIVGSLILAAPLGQRLAAAPTPTPAPTPAAGARQRRVAGALLAGLAAVIIARVAIPMQRAEGATNPARAIAAAVPLVGRDRVFNDYGMGGSLILAGVRPFIDGRADMYGDGFFQDFDTIASGDGAAFERAVSTWGLRWTILPPQSPLVGWLDHSPQWQRLYADRWAVVHRMVTPPRPQPKASHE